MVEIGINAQQPRPHPGIWVTSGENFGWGPYVSHPDWVCTDQISHFISAQPIQYLIISIMNGWTRLRLVYMGSKMVTTTCFLVMSGYKFGLAQPHFSHPDWLCSDWFRQFTASQPFQYLIISIMNGWTRLRFEFIMYNHHHSPRLLSHGWWQDQLQYPTPYISHKDCVCLDWL